MGVMSKAKGSRLPERPKPPSWDDISEDITHSERDDPVFGIGKIHLPPPTSTTPEEKNSSNNLDLDTSETDLHTAEKLYENILRLISTEEHLSSAPSMLKEHYSNLKREGEAMQTSISQLRDLQRSLASTVSSAASSSDVGEVKAKSKHKKKK